MAIATFAGYLLFDRQAPPRLTLITLLTLCMAAWVTLSLTWSVVPDDAYTKWNWR